MKMQGKQIPTFIINLKERTDRRAHILKQFEGKEEFQIQLVDATQRKNGRIGLWQTIIKIIKKAQKDKLPYVLICEDDHTFTNSYTKKKLFEVIEWAISHDIELLSGGVSWFDSTLQLTHHLFWVNLFSGFQFTLVFNNMFEKILTTDFQPTDAADYKTASLAEKKVVLYPFISTQKEFGYSDVTSSNNKKNHVKQLFGKTQLRLKLLKKVAHCYRRSEEKAVAADDFKDVSIPTYVIHLPERKERLKHIQEQFKGKEEFDVQVVEACKHKIGAVGLWNSIRKVVEIAKENEDDVIIICEDDHTFTKHYSKEYLFHTIVSASEKNADLLNFGVGGFNQVVLVSKNMYWVDSFWCTQFVVIYRSFFDAILSEPFTEKDTADGKFSEMTTHKFAAYPLISIQKDFGYSDVTETNHSNKGRVADLFRLANEKFKKIHTLNIV